MTKLREVNVEQSMSQGLLDRYVTTGFHGLRKRGQRDQQDAKETESNENGAQSEARGSNKRRQQREATEGNGNGA